MKNKIILVMGIALLTGCGGGTDGSKTSTSGETNTVTQTDNTCKSDGNTVLVPEGEKCTYSIPSVNNGAVETYSCTNNRVSYGGISAAQLNFNGTIITCE